MGVFDWTDEMKSAAMADAATVCKQAARISELEATIAEMHASTRRYSFDCEWYLQGVRHNPGEYVLMRVGPATKDEHPF